METIRKRVEENMLGEITNALIKSHEINYETLYVHHDGSLQWLTSISSDERLIDDQADGDNIAAVAHLIQVGTGSIACNCDNCVGPNSSPIDIENNADDYSYVESSLEKNLKNIKYGYFNDEED